MRFPSIHPHPEERTEGRTWNWRERRVSSLPEDAEPCHRPRRMRSVRTQDLSVLAGPSGLGEGGGRREEGGGRRELVLVLLLLVLLLLPPPP